MVWFWLCCVVLWHPGCIDYSLLVARVSQNLMRKQKGKMVHLFGDLLLCFGLQVNSCLYGSVVDCYFAFERSHYRLYPENVS